MLMTLLLTLLVLGILSIPAISIWKNGSDNKLIFETLYIMLLIWFLRFVVGIINPEQQLSYVEVFFDSIVHALQSFSLDEGYAEYTINGKNILSAGGMPVWAGVYGVVVSILNVCAPVLGGAVLLNLISEIFPAIKIHMMPTRHKFVFSELNEMSITLAEDLLREEQYKSIVSTDSRKLPLIIFTDAYPDKSSEPRSEMFERAYNIGAVCIKKDLLHLPLKESRSIDYFLIDSDTQDNIRTLPELLNSKDRLWILRKMQAEGNESKEPCVRIFVFTKDDTEALLITKIREKNKNTDDVIIRTINDYFNLAVNLVYDVPLFLPLLNTEKKDLTVSILGAGSIAEEVFKAVFWCGQICGVRLSINVIAENAAALKSKLENNCPELLASCDKDAELLTVCPATNEKNEPYCKSCEFMNIPDVSLIDEIPEKILEDTDYYVIALGSDGMDIDVATGIKSRLDVWNLENTNPRKVIIATSVYEETIADAIKSEADENVLLVPFATLRSRFGVENIFMDRFTEDAKNSCKAYGVDEQNAYTKDEYTYWANNTKTVHAAYKAFGLGIIDAFDFSEKGTARWRCAERGPLTEDETNLLAWIEHRRWNAVLRTMGFSCPTKTQYDAYFKLHTANKNFTHKDRSLKFHPCLVESKAMFYGREYKLADDIDGIREEEKGMYDTLDYSTMYQYATEKMIRSSLGQPMERNAEDFSYKKYDYYTEEQDSALHKLIQKAITK